MTCKSTFTAPPPISMPKRADWIVFATSRVSLVFASLRDRMIPGSEVRAYGYARESVWEEMP